jgi:putative ABC transport system ATP-binding protein
MATLLEANEVTKIYAKGQRPSLNKVSFNVAESEFIAIMGASGSGKTTLLMFFPLLIPLQVAAL